MWNVSMYKAVLKAIKDSGKYRGKDIHTMEELYELISADLLVSVDTLKSWARSYSKGPSRKDDLKKLAELTCCPLEKLDGEKCDVDTNLLINIRYKSDLTKNQNNEEMHEINLTDFSKTHVMNVYSLVKAYLESDCVEDIEAYEAIVSEIETLKIAIPAAIYKKIYDYIDTYIAPIAYDSNSLFADCYTEEIGKFNEDGCFQTNDEAATLKFCVMFSSKIHDIKKAWEQFAIEELQPYLIR